MDPRIRIHLTVVAAQLQPRVDEEPGEGDAQGAQPAAPGHPRPQAGQEPLRA